MAAVLGGAAVGGAIGGGLAVTILGPLTAANNFIGSFFFGDGMIIGERLAYQNDWPKIQIRMKNGESFLTILEEYTRNNTAAVMQSARTIIEIVTPLWFDMVSQYLKSIPQELLNQLNSSAPVRTTVAGAAAQEIGVPQWVIDLGGAAFAEEQKSTGNTVTTPEWERMTLQQLSQERLNYIRAGQNPPARLTQLYQNALALLKKKSTTTVRDTVVNKPTTIKSSGTKLSRGNQLLQDGLTKYFLLYKNTKANIISLEKQLGGTQFSSRKNSRDATALLAYKKSLIDIIQIFNSKLGQAKRIPELFSWHDIKPLK